MGTPLTTVATAIVPCNDLDIAEAWWSRLGFTRPADQGHDDYRMLSDGFGGEVHLNRAVEGWVIPGRNPFGVYLYTARVDALAERLQDTIIERSRSAEHKAWGMYEFALNGPDDLLVRVGWPSHLIRPTLERRMPANQQLADQNFASAVLRNCSFAHATFDDLNMADCAFSNINLERSRFTDVNLTGVRIDDANIDGLIIMGHDIRKLIDAEVTRSSSSSDRSNCRP